MDKQPTLTLIELAPDPLPSHESYSPFCLKAHRALKVAGLRYERRPGRTPSERKQYNPTGQVPVLLVGGEAVPDSTAILSRVVAIAPGRIDDSPEAWLWEEFADVSLSGFLVAARWADPRNWPGVKRAYFGGLPLLLRMVLPDRIRARVVGGLHARDVWRAGEAACWARFTRTLDQLEARAPEYDYWLGGAISVGDIAIFAQLHSLRTPLTQWQSDEVAKRARLSRYLDRVDAATRASAPLVRAAS